MLNTQSTPSASRVGKISKAKRFAVAGIAALFLLPAMSTTAAALGPEDVPQLDLANKKPSWSRLLVNRVGECGRIGNSDMRRIDYLAEKYDAFAEAVASGSEAQMRATATDLKAYIDKNSRAEKCWERFRSHARIPYSAVKAMKSMSS